MSSRGRLTLQLARIALANQEPAMISLSQLSFSDVNILLAHKGDQLNPTAAAAAVRVLPGIPEQLELSRLSSSWPLGQLKVLETSQKCFGDHSGALEHIFVNFTCPLKLRVVNLLNCRNLKITKSVVKNEAKICVYCLFEYGVGVDDMGVVGGGFESGSSFD